MRTNQVLMVFTGYAQFGNSNRPTGYWLSEAAHVYYPLREAGYTVHFASPGSVTPPLDPASAKRPDTISQRWLNDSIVQAALQHPFTADNLDPSHYAAVYYPGGHGPLWDLATDTRFAQLAARIYENGGVIAAVCHGPAALLPVRLSNGEHLLAGKTYTGFTNTEERLSGKTKLVPFLLEDKLRALGGTYRKALAFSQHVVVDQRIVTGQNPRSAAPLAQALLTELSQLITT